MAPVSQNLFEETPVWSQSENYWNFKFTLLFSFSGCRNTQHNDTQHNDSQHNDPQHNDSQHNDTQHNGVICDTKYIDAQKNDTQHDTQHNDI